jgi:putative transposase
MPWRTLDIMNQRMEFIVKAREGEQSFRSLCQKYGISAKTGYKWLKRSEQSPLLGLQDRSRRPLRYSLGTDIEVALELVRLKIAHLRWGPKKIRVLYERIHASAPSLSTVKRILDRVGLVEHRKRRHRSVDGRIQTQSRCEAPNDVWTVDFKGAWRTEQRVRCEPLTVTDFFSRYVLTAMPLGSSDTEQVKMQFEKLFHEYGLPLVIHSDNGVPFASASGLLGLTRLSAWWLALGIGLDQGRPAHPQDNAAHERMHLDITRQVESVSTGGLKENREALELWRHEYNEIRPHETLHNKTPASLYTKSPRPYQGSPKSLAYGLGFISRIVSNSGYIGLSGNLFFISNALAGWNVGLRPRRANLIEVYFAQLYLGYLDLQTLSFRGAASRSPEARLPNHNQ